MDSKRGSGVGSGPAGGAGRAGGVWEIPPWDAINEDVEMFNIMVGEIGPPLAGLQQADRTGDVQGAVKSVAALELLTMMLVDLATSIKMHCQRWQRSAYSVHGHASSDYYSQVMAEAYKYMTESSEGDHDEQQGRRTPGGDSPCEG